MGTKGSGVSVAYSRESYQQLLVQGRKIMAVKLYRMQHHCGLKEAVDAITAMEMPARAAEEYEQAMADQAAMEGLSGDDL